MLTISPSLSNSSGISSSNLSVSGISASIPDTGYKVFGLDFDGANSFRTGADASSFGAADSQKLLFFKSIYMTVDGTVQYLVQQTPNINYIRKNASNKIGIQWRNPANTLVVNADIVENTLKNTWHNILIGIDMTVPFIKIYDGNTALSVSGGTLVLTPGATLDFTKTALGIDNTSGAGNLFLGQIGEFYMNINATNVDVADAALRAKFVDPITGKPVSLGADGSLPTGSQPFLYFKGPAATCAVNYGYGAPPEAFSAENVTDSSNSPTN